MNERGTKVYKKMQELRSNFQIEFGVSETTFHVVIKEEDVFGRAM